MVMTVEPAVILRAADGSSVRIDQFPTVLGRFHPEAPVQPDCDVSALDPQSWVSRRHLSLDVVNGRLVVTDLGSTNGSWADGQPLVAQQPTAVGPTAELMLGHLKLRVELEVSSPAPEALGQTVVAGEDQAMAPSAAPPQPAHVDRIEQAVARPGEAVAVPAGVVEVAGMAVGAGAPEVAEPILAAQRFPVLQVFNDPTVSQLVVQPGRVPRLEQSGRWVDAIGPELSALDWDK